MLLLTDLTVTAFGDLFCKITLSEVEFEKRIECVYVFKVVRMCCCLGGLGAGWQKLGTALVSSTD